MSSDRTRTTASSAETAAHLREIARSMETRINPMAVEPLLLRKPHSRAHGIGQPLGVGTLVYLALANDALCVAETAITRDRIITEDEALYVSPLVHEVLPYLRRVRDYYEEFSLEGDGVKQFLEAHSADRQPFGGDCKHTRWAGVDLCRRFASEESDGGPLRDYADTLARMIDDIFDLSPGDSSSARGTLRATLATRAGVEEGAAGDPRERAFCSGSADEVFHAVAHAQDVFTPDRLDVESIHQEARQAFERCVRRAGASPTNGRILLMKGESGAGKTHLMRAFRTSVHRDRLGFATYMQMSTQSTNYARYILANVIDSLDRPFLPGEPPALSGIGDAMLKWAAPPALVNRLQMEDLSLEERANVVGQVADHVVSTPGYEGIDVDLIRALAFLVCGSPNIRARVLRYLRCDDLADYDRRLLGGMAPRLDEGAPMTMLAGLGRVAFAADGGALVLLLDQLEDLTHYDGSDHRFRSLMDTLRQISDQVPTSVAVVACLADYYENFRPSLTGPLLDRLEHDPEPVQLTGSRTAEEVQQIVSQRLRYLFESQGARFQEEDALWPFPRESVLGLATLRTRDVLDWCRRQHVRCIQAGDVSPARKPTTPENAIPPVAPPVANEWLAFRTREGPPPASDTERTALLAWAVRQSARELGLMLDAVGTFPIEIRFAEIAQRPMVLALCDKGAQGGGLGRQIDEAAHRAATLSASVILARSSEFPAPGRSVVSNKIGAVVKNGGRKVVLSDGDWREIQALHRFLADLAPTTQLERWLRADRPLARIDPMRAIFEGVTPQSASRSTPHPNAAVRPAQREPSHHPPPSPSIPVTSPHAPRLLDLGQTRSLAPKDVVLPMDQLTTHAAFLGTTKSGKTTLALNIVEQCLLAGIPALLVDRKGDLATYGSSEYWAAPESDADRTRRKRELRARVEVSVFTPGTSQGRPLTLPLIPAGLGDMAAHDRSMIADSAAAALGAMMGYRRSQQDDARLAILAKAIEIIGPVRGDSATLEDLIELIHHQDPTLVDAVGRLDPKHFKALVEHLSTLQLRHQILLSGEGEVLSPELLFGLGEAKPAGKTRVSVISTKFFADPSVVDFWVSRLLIELARWASRHPAPALQALVLFDEADIYLPATSKPATKQPMQELLRRARSAGMGVLLATQSPGDFDYKCRDNIRTWFVGRVAEKTAVDKMKPLLGDYRGSPAAKLASAQTGEFFVLADGEVSELKARRAIMETRQLSEGEILRAASQSRIA